VLQTNVDVQCDKRAAHAAVDKWWTWRNEMAEKSAELRVLKQGSGGKEMTEFAITSL